MTGKRRGSMEGWRKTSLKGTEEGRQGVSEGSTVGNAIKHILYKD